MSAIFSNLKQFFRNLPFLFEFSESQKSRCFYRIAAKLDKYTVTEIHGQPIKKPLSTIIKVPQGSKAVTEAANYILGEVFHLCFAWCLLYCIVEYCSNRADKVWVGQTESRTDKFYFRIIHIQSATTIR